MELRNEMIEEKAMDTIVVERNGLSYIAIYIYMREYIYTVRAAITIYYPENKLKFG